MLKILVMVAILLIDPVQALASGLSCQTELEAHEIDLLLEVNSSSDKIISELARQRRLLSTTVEDQLLIGKGQRFGPGKPDPATGIVDYNRRIDTGVVTHNVLLGAESYFRMSRIHPCWYIVEQRGMSPKLYLTPDENERPGRLYRVNSGALTREFLERITTPQQVQINEDYVTIGASSYWAFSQDILKREIEEAGGLHVARYERGVHFTKEFHPLLSTKENQIPETLGLLNDWFGVLISARNDIQGFRATVPRAQMVNSKLLELGPSFAHLRFTELHSQRDPLGDGTNNYWTNQHRLEFLKRIADGEFPIVIEDWQVTDLYEGVKGAFLFPRSFLNWYRDVARELIARYERAVEASDRNRVDMLMAHLVWEFESIHREMRYFYDGAYGTAIDGSIWRLRYHRYVLSQSVLQSPGQFLATDFLDIRNRIQAQISEGNNDPTGGNLSPTELQAVQKIDREITAQRETLNTLLFRLLRGGDASPSKFY